MKYHNILNPPHSRIIPKSKTYLFLALTALTISCQSIGQNHSSNVAIQVSDNVPAVEQKKVPITYGDKDVVTAGYLDSNGNLWFTTTREGVFKYDGKTFINYTKDNGLCSNNINSVVEDEKGLMWFGTDDGICTFDQNKFVHIPIPWEGFAGAKTVLSLMQASNGDIWLGTWGGGAFRYDGKTFTSVLANGGRVQNDGLFHNVIKSIMEDADGNIWISSLSHGGITRFDGKNYITYKEDDGLCEDMVFCIFQDSKQDIWIGSNSDADLCRFNGKTFTHYSEKDGLCDYFVSCFYEDSKGNIWLGSEGPGVCIFDGTSFKPFTTKNGQSMDATIRFIVEDKDANIWLGGRRGSLWRFDGEELKDFTGVYNE